MFICECSPAPPVSSGWTQRTRRSAAQIKGSKITLHKKHYCVIAIKAGNFSKRLSRNANQNNGRLFNSLLLVCTLIRVKKPAHLLSVLVKVECWHAFDLTGLSHILQTDRERRLVIWFLFYLDKQNSSDFSFLLSVVLSFAIFNVQKRVNKSVKYYIGVLLNFISQ